MNGKPTWIPVLIFAGFVMLMLVFVSQIELPQPNTQVSYSEFKELLRKDEIAEVTLRGERIHADLKRELPLGLNAQPVDRLSTTLPPMGDPELLKDFETHNVGIDVQSSVEGLGASTLLNFLPWLILIGVYFWFMSRMYSNMAGRMGGRTPTDFLAGSTQAQAKGRPKIRFEDVAGQDNAKREVQELVDFLKDPDRFRKLGAEPPHGILLMGPPGTGKTLLARALAGEAGVPFFHISASEFIEMYVGVGASRVRHMFDEAKKRAPAIIFVDELDSVGRVRGTGMGGGNDEREQTLNQILAELDGFAGHEAVVVLAATNRPDVLDPALLRPGRFDRHVVLELPDRKAREEILEVHTRNVPLSDDVDLSVMAAGTPGFSGADLKNLVNEAAIAGAREGVEKVTMAHLDQMRDKVMMGSVRTMAIQPEERHRLAVHESGHTVVAHYLPGADPLYKVTIIPRGRSLGGTHLMPKEDRHTLPEDYLRDRLAVTLGGRTAERALLGTVSSGADDDIQKATQLARAMVTRWGMADEIGPVDLRQSEEHPFLGREIAQPRRFSETTAHEVDKAVGQLLREAEARASEAITTHRAKVEQLVAELEEQETLGHDAIEKCLGPAIGRATPDTRAAE